MIEWALIVILAALAGDLWIRWREWRFAVERLRENLTEISSGREISHPRLGSRREFRKLSELIAALKREQDHVRRQRELADQNLEIILGSMEEGVMVVDSRKEIRLVNRSFQQLFQLSSSQSHQTVLETLSHPGFDELVTSALETQESQHTELPVDFGRNPRYVAATAQPMRDASGEPGVVMIFRDVTRLRQLEEVRREFVANVSHELRTPLAIFQGYVETLVDYPTMEEAERMRTYNILLRHSQRLNALVEDLLELARLESRQEDIEREPVDVGAYFDELVQDWAKRTRDKGVTISSEVEPDLPRAFVDRFRFEQVFTNLMDNALKYTPAGGSITLKARRCDGQIETRVEDTGIGIPPADLPKIFDRFYRVDKARSREIGGTGLGLTIVKHIVQMHGGIVRGESGYGKGKGTSVIVLWEAAPDVAPSSQDLPTFNGSEPAEALS
jgi:two-component system phosphate regulon sensor histidine kinase PhoR